MKNKYDEIKEKHQQRVNNFPMIFAFSQEQLYEGMKKLGLKIKKYNDASLKRL